MTKNRDYHILVFDVYTLREKGHHSDKIFNLTGNPGHFLKSVVLSLFTLRERSGTQSSLVSFLSNIGSNQAVVTTLEHDQTQFNSQTSEVFTQSN